MDSQTATGFGTWIDALPVVAFECDHDGALRFASASWGELTGQPVQVALGQGWLAHLEPAGPASLLEALGVAGRSEAPVAWAVRCRAKDGEWYALRTWLRARREGEQVLGFLGVAVLPGHDVSATELTDALLEATPDLLFHLSPVGGVLGFRAGDAARLPLKPEAMVGRTLEAVLPPEVAKASRVALERARATRLPATVEYRLGLPGGDLDFEACFTPLEGGGFLCRVRDVTETKRAQADLAAAHDAALELSRSRSQFLANVSHEIRTPLNAILAVTQLLRQQALPGDLKEYLQVLEGSSETLMAIVNDVLDLSKIDANRLELETRVFDLEPVIISSVVAFQAQARRKGLDLQVEVAPGARGPVRGDSTRVRQITANLVGNAVKFTERGHVKVTVQRLAGELVRLAVEDTGPGIAQEDHARIFEPFEQADVGVQRRFGGTGLGLTITRRLARLMGGEVRVASQPGHGATFALEVPLPSVVLEGVAPRISRVTPAPKSMRVLLAEDDPINATMMAALLTRFGHAVEVVGTGRACLEAVGRGEIDLVLMDVHMPELDGLDAARQIRADEAGSGRHLPIVALTADAMQGDDLRCLSAGMDAYLPKPVNVGALQDVLLWFGGREG